jgi:TRAP-type C4-dicarboxylate transport system permease small subunit
MARLLAIPVERVSKLMQVISGTALTAIMLLTVTDVALRIAGRPISGVYELVGLGGGIVIAFAMPITSFLRGHIYVDTVLTRLPPHGRRALLVATRVFSIVTFILIGWNLFKMGFDLKAAGEVTLTRRLPFYPIAYGVGACCFAECFVLLLDIFKILRGEDE